MEFKLTDEHTARLRELEEAYTRARRIADEAMDNRSAAQSALETYRVEAYGLTGKVVCYSVNLGYVGKGRTENRRLRVESVHFSSWSKNWEARGRRLKKDGTLSGYSDSVSLGKVTSIEDLPI